MTTESTSAVAAWFEQQPWVFADICYQYNIMIALAIENATTADGRRRKRLQSLHIVKFEPTTMAPPWPPTIERPVACTTSRNSGYSEVSSRVVWYAGDVETK